MFGFKIISKINNVVSKVLSEDIKPKVSQNFLSTIEDAKIKVKENQDKTEDLYEKHFYSGIKKLRNFEKREDVNEAIKSFIEAIKLKNGRAEPYFLLAYCANIIGNTNLSIKYLHVAESINPSLFGISELKNDITQSLLKNREEKEILPTKNNTQISKPMVTKVNNQAIQPVKKVTSLGIIRK